MRQTAPIQAGLKSAKVVFDGIQIGLDVIIAASAAYNASKATTPESKAAYNSLLQNYEANIIGDAITTVIDVIDLASVGAANGENVKQAATGLKNLIPASKAVKDIIRGIILAWFGVYGGGLMPKVGDGGSSPGGGGAGGSGAGGSGAGGSGGVARLASLQLIGEDDISPALSAAGRQAASGIIRAEIGKMRTVYTTADVALSGSQTILDQIMTQTKARLTELNGGKDPVKTFVKTVSDALNQLNGEISALTQMGVLATSAKDRSDAIIKYSDEAISAVDSIKVPDFKMKKEGSGGLLDAATDLLQTQVLDRLVNLAREKVENAKTKAKSPIGTVKGSATDVAEFSVILQKTATDAVGQIQARIQKFSGALAKCNSVEDIVNTMISQIFEALGLGEGFTIAEALQAWKSLGPMLDDADKWAAGLATSGPAGGRVEGENEEPEGPEPAAAPAAPEE